MENRVHLIFANHNGLAGALLKLPGDGYIFFPLQLKQGGECKPNGKRKPVGIVLPG
jgi:hypothetical protein